MSRCRLGYLFGSALPVIALALVAVVPPATSCGQRSRHFGLTYRVSNFSVSRAPNIEDPHCRLVIWGKTK